MYSYISAIAYSVIPVIVYVFPLLVCPYANTLARKYINGFRSIIQNMNFYQL